MRKEPERKAACFPEILSFLQRLLDSSFVLRADVLGPVEQLQPQAGQARRTEGTIRQESPPSFPACVYSGVPAGSDPSLQAPPSPLISPTPILRRRPAPPPAPFLRPPPPAPWGADSPGCHVSLMTSPGPLALSQSARGSPSEVLASKSAGRGAGRGGGGRGESGDEGGRQPLKYACAGGAGLGGKLSPSLRPAPSVPRAHLRARNSLSRQATRCGRPLGCVKTPRPKAFLFPGSPAAILGGSDR